MTCMLSLPIKFALTATTGNYTGPLVLGWGDGIPDLGDVAARVHLEDLPDDLWRAPTAAPGIDGLVPGGDGGDVLRVGVALAEIDRARDRGLAGIGFGVTGQVGA